MIRGQLVRLPGKSEKSCIVPGTSMLAEASRTSSLQSESGSSAAPSRPAKSRTSGILARLSRGHARVAGHGRCRGGLRRSLDGRRGLFHDHRGRAWDRTGPDGGGARRGGHLRRLRRGVGIDGSAGRGLDDHHEQRDEDRIAHQANHEHGCGSHGERPAFLAVDRHVAQTDSRSKAAAKGASQSTPRGHQSEKPDNRRIAQELRVAGNRVRGEIRGRCTSRQRAVTARANRSRYTYTPAGLKVTSRRPIVTQNWSPPRYWAVAGTPARGPASCPDGESGAGGSDPRDSLRREACRGRASP